MIVAHAASFALRGRRDTLRVFLTASPETRTGRLAQDAKQLAKLDANRADYLKRFYEVGVEQPHHYDIVLNTDHLEPAAAAAVVVGLALT
ncbi:MAG TPA: cytidylate kinase family protein [Sporichthyaceae bacterium]|nr:cytidylate kinase family protein [Sporichthyaceae bacterium]